MELLNEYQVVLVRYGELTLKGKNKKDFIKKLIVNLKTALKAYPLVKVNPEYDRMFIDLNGTDPNQIVPIISKVFGISSYSLAVKTPNEIEAIVDAATALAVRHQCSTFKVFARRSNKNFPMLSDQINREVATSIYEHTALKVDIHHPELCIYIEVRDHETFVMDNRFAGAGGFPVGVSSKVLLLLSGGIDSAVAGYLAMKRGLQIECIHFESAPYTSPQALAKVKRLAEILSVYQGEIRLHVVPFTALQLAIYDQANESYAITIMRRMMMRIAEELAHKRRCLAIVNGESVGQVASQTINSMQVIGEVVNLPIIRPLVTYDKEEIITVAKKIGTYETSCIPFADCCTIFTPKNPITKPVTRHAQRYEHRFDYQALIAECLANTQVVHIHPGYAENDLF